MTYEPPARTVRPCDTVSASARLGQPLAEKSRPDTPAPKQSKTPSAARCVTFATANHAKPSSELDAKGVSCRRAARIAREHELAALCQRRASLWADTIRAGLDPDIARFVRDQSAAWHLLATNFARSATDAPNGQADAH